MEIVLLLLFVGAAVLAAAMVGDLMAGVAVVVLMIVFDLAIFGGSGLLSAVRVWPARRTTLIRS